MLASALDNAGALAGIISTALAVGGAATAIYIRQSAKRRAEREKEQARALFLDGRPANHVTGEARVEPAAERLGEVERTMVNVQQSQSRTEGWVRQIAEHLQLSLSPGPNGGGRR